MTFKQFEHILFENRSDIKRAMKRGTKVYIFFAGNEKAYGYSGSYADVLDKLDIHFNCPKTEASIKHRLATELDNYLEEDMMGYFDINYQEGDPLPLIQNEKAIAETLDRLDLVRTYPFYDVYI